MRGGEEAFGRVVGAKPLRENRRQSKGLNVRRNSVKTFAGELDRGISNRRTVVTFREEKCDIDRREKKGEHRAGTQGTGVGTISWALKAGSQRHEQRIENSRGKPSQRDQEEVKTAEHQRGNIRSTNWVSDAHLGCRKQDSARNISLPSVVRPWSRKGMSREIDIGLPRHCGVTVSRRYSSPRTSVERGGIAIGPNETRKRSEITLKKKTHVKFCRMKRVRPLAGYLSSTKHIGW